MYKDVTAIGNKWSFYSTIRPTVQYVITKNAAAAVATAVHTKSCWSMYQHNPYSVRKSIQKIMIIICVQNKGLNVWSKGH